MAKKNQPQLAAMKEKTKRFDSKVKAESYVKEKKLVGVFPVKLKKMNHALCMMKNGVMEYMMTDGTFKAFDPAVAWRNIEPECVDHNSGSIMYSVSDDGILKPKLWWKKNDGKVDRAAEIEEVLNRVNASEIEPLSSFRCESEYIDPDTCTIIPIADPHFGMHSWAPETGVDYDLKIAEKVFRTGLVSLLDREAANPSKRAVLAFLGDFMHIDSYKAVTPENGHLLDADTRYGKIFERAYALAVAAIKRVAAIHEEVTVFFLQGNHDRASSTAIQVALRYLFAENERIHVQREFSRHAFFRFGNNLTGFHHGDINRKELPIIMADESPFWSECPFRLWLHGHVHQGGRVETRGCTVEGIESITPSDAWSSSKGYGKKHSSMVSIRQHMEYGEIQRTKTMINFDRVKACL